MKRLAGIMKASIFLLLFVALAALPVGVSGQPSLVVTGSVVKLDTKCIHDKPVPQISVYIQFRNTGDSPLLLIPPDLAFERRVSFSGEEAGKLADDRVSGSTFSYNPYLDDPFGTPTEEDYDPLPGYIATLRSRKEPVNILDAGGYFEFHDTMWPKSGFKFKSSGSQNGCSPGSVRPLPEYPYLTIEYYLSLKKYKGGDDLFRILQDRWKRFGHLPLNDKGEVVYRSEKIRLATGSQNALEPAN